MDMNILYALQNLRTPAISGVMNALSILAGNIVILGFLCLIFWCVDKHLGYKVIFTFCLSGIAVQGLKVILKVPRPWLRDSRLFVDRFAEEDATGFSFPSGHTQCSTSFFGMLALQLKKWWGRVLCFVVIALIMLSRMFLGCHTPQDVIVAFLITIAIVILVDRIVNNSNDRSKTYLRFSLVTALLSVLCVVYTLFSIYSGGISPEEYGNAYDAIKMSGAGLGTALGAALEVKTLDFAACDGRGFARQALKYAIGVAVALAFMSLPKKLITDTTGVATVCLIHILRYFAATIWAVYIYPVIFTKFRKH